jgi:hypothetical protein
MTDTEVQEADERAAAHAGVEAQRDQQRERHRRHVGGEHVEDRRAERGMEARVVQQEPEVVEPDVLGRRGEVVVEDAEVEDPQHRIDREQREEDQRGRGEGRAREVPALEMPRTPIHPDAVSRRGSR